MIYLLIIISFSGGYRADVVAQYDTEFACEAHAKAFRSIPTTDTFTCVQVKAWKK